MISLFPSSPSILSSPWLYVTSDEAGADVLSLLTVGLAGAALGFEPVGVLALFADEEVPSDEEPD